eukprot:Em0008g780a
MQMNLDKPSSEATGTSATLLSLFARSDAKYSLEKSNGQHMRTNICSTDGHVSRPLWLRALYKKLRILFYHFKDYHLQNKDQKRLKGEGMVASVLDVEFTSSQSASLKQ